jgi:hypothetical protein
MGADQHITDPDDRADLVVRAFELYNEYQSLSKVREWLARDPVTLRVCGGPRTFSRDTLTTWIDEGRAAEAYAELLDLAQQRSDCNTRLSLLAATMWEHLRLRNGGTLDTGELVTMLDFMRKIERDRMDLLGLRVPVVNRVQLEQSGPVEIPADMRAAVEAARRRAVEQGRALVEDGYPGATVVPARRGRRGNRRSS